ncbi:MAG: PQQ-binding-like beta-propeller repeat protein [Acidobacteriota bacterium]|nr:PQQ-binding-like beta-propeller repeat protein [Acidobacteriota bacterium]
MSPTVSLNKCWAYPIESVQYKFLASDNQLIFIAIEDGSVQAIDSKTSGSIWTTDLGGGIVSNIAINETNVFVATNSIAGKDAAAPEASILRSLSKKTGITNWSIRLPFSAEMVLGGARGRIIAAGSEGTITALDNKTGNIDWKAPLSGQLSAALYFSSDTITYGTDQNEIVSISAETGERIFRRPVKFRPTAIAYLSENKIVTGDERGNVALINTLNGQSVWEFKSGAGISAISTSGSGLVVTSLDNFIYMISPKNGDVIWKRRMPGRILHGVLVTDNFVFALIYGESSAYLIDTKKGKLIDQLVQTDKNYQNRAPLLVNDSNIVFATADGVESHSVSGCHFQ